MVEINKIKQGDKIYYRYKRNLYSAWSVGYFQEIVGTSLVVISSSTNPVALTAQNIYSICEIEVVPA